MKLIVPILLLFIAFSCSEENPVQQTIVVESRWIEIINESDTISFESLDGLKVISLKRGTEIQNGQSIPKPGAGLYDFKITNDKISLRWYLSSNSAFNDYYFNKSDDELQIENFYDEGASGIINTFRRTE
ncbi:hypothetical protein [Fulvivirga lutea]|uniref:Uncharacterized protein n=1 Tax=Fulvivirga lutea TaxID=2810512 RepID=A0A975A0X1_9BACT|nr:hypothetical protein [Fulvivirga lutea]QSE97256.1 hypothetical protein JR347_16945 [Fulvivirga lutea]